MLEDPFAKKAFIVSLSMNNVQFRLTLSRNLVLWFSFLINLFDFLIGTWCDVGEIIGSFFQKLIWKIRAESEILKLQKSNSN